MTRGETARHADTYGAVNVDRNVDVQITWMELV